MTVLEIDRSQLTPTHPANAGPGYRYYVDPVGSLYAEKASKEGATLRFLAAKGKWDAAAPSLRRAPVPTTPLPRPESDEGTVSENVPEEIPTGTTVPTFRFSFSYRTLLNGAPGELTIEASTGAGLKLKLPEVMAHFAPLDPAPHDEYFVFLADGTAFCRRHNKPMEERTMQGDKWWSHNAGTKTDPCYCKGRPGKDSPGWSK